MSAIKAAAGGGSSARYKTENHHDRNKERDSKKLAKGLEQRKDWRIQKYKNTPQAELSRTTITLFKAWGVELVGPKRTVKVVAPVIHKRWGKKQ